MMGRKKNLYAYSLYLSGGIYMVHLSKEPVDSAMNLKRGLNVG